MTTTSSSPIMETRTCGGARTCAHRHRSAQCSGEQQQGAAERGRYLRQVRASACRRVRHQVLFRNTPQQRSIVQVAKLQPEINVNDCLTVQNMQDLKFPKKNRSLNGCQLFATNSEGEGAVRPEGWAVGRRYSEACTEGWFDLAGKLCARQRAAGGPRRHACICDHQPRPGRRVAKAETGLRAVLCVRGRGGARAAAALPAAMSFSWLVERFSRSLLNKRLLRDFLKEELDEQQVQSDSHVEMRERRCAA